MDEATAAFLRGDLSTARGLFEVLAATGSKGALLALAKIYERGGTGVSQDLDKARYWYERAFSEANAVNAALWLGHFYCDGRGVAVNYDKAFFYYSKLANSNDPVALLRLGVLYETGRGVEKDLTKARDFYRCAAHLGNLFARKNWGVLEIRRGNWIMGLFQWAWASVQGTPLAFINADDKRLRTS